MNYNIELESENLIFIKPTYDFIDDCLIVANDEENIRFISKRERNYSREDEIEWIKSKIESGTVLFVLEKNTHKFVGTFEFLEITDDYAELGLCITRSMQNRGYGTEIEKRIIDYSFNKLNLKYLTAYIFDYNERSLHCSKKLGFTEFEVGEEVDGHWGKVKEIGLKLTKEDYLKINGKSI